jgi:hypothetical protein
MTRHTLLEPRVVAAVGLIALGISIGMGLILAQKFALVGLVLWLTSVGGVIWIYYSKFFQVYRSLTERRAYSGTDGRELLLIFVLLIVDTTLSFSLYFSPPDTTNPSIRSSLAVDSVSPVKYPNVKNTEFNVDIKNVGNLAATKAITETGGMLAGHVLSAEEERTEMNKLISAMQRVPKRNREGEIQVGQSSIITIPDPKNERIGLQATDGNLADINGGKLLLYVFVVAEYSDEYRNNEDWRLEYCGYFVTTYAYWHNCGWRSRVYRMSTQ